MFNPRENENLVVIIRTVGFTKRLKHH